MKNSKIITLSVESKSLTACNHPRRVGVITYILLCGYPPFYGDSDTQIFDAVKVAKFDFPSPEWDEISQSAKDFVVALLKKNPADRPTAEDALNLKWLTEQLGDEASQRKQLLRRGNRGEEFSRYLGMKKLKKHALGYIAANLTQEQVGYLGEIFKSIDEKGNGVITLIELDQAIAEGKLIRFLDYALILAIRCCKG